MRPTYKQQYDKIIDAYFKDEIKPSNTRFCFCGTLADGPEWQYPENMRIDEHYYSYKEYGRMERALFSSFRRVTWNHNGSVTTENFMRDLDRDDDYEINLFKGMCAALEELKQIHIEGGEVIDEVPTFTKRQLQTI